MHVRVCIYMHALVVNLDRMQVYSKRHDMYHKGGIMCMSICLSNV